MINVAIFKAAQLSHLLIFASIMTPLAVHTSSAAKAIAVETRKLIASDASSYNAANTVGINETGDLVVLGDGQRVRGTSYLFERNLGGPNAWQERKRFEAYDGFDFDRFGRSPQISGDILAINNRPNGNAARTGGAIYLYGRDTSGPDNWGFIRKLTGSSSDQFANTFDLVGGRIAAGAPFDNEAAFDAGACYIFEQHLGGSNNWGQVIKIISPDPGVGEEFGFWPSLDGNTLAVTERYDFEDDLRSVTVFIYEQMSDTGDWQFMKRIKPPISGVYDVGNTLAPPIELKGDVLVLGMEWDDTAGRNAGAAAIYYRNEDAPDQWGIVRKIVPNGASPGDLFGTRLALHDDILAVSAFGEFDDGTRKQGAVYLFQRDFGGQDNWGQIARVTPSDANLDNEGFGCCRIDFEAELLAVPAYKDDAVGTDSGSLFLFQVFEPPTLSMNRVGEMIQLHWRNVPGVSFELLHAPTIGSESWMSLGVSNSSSFSIFVTNQSEFFKLQMESP